MDTFLFSIPKGIVQKLQNFVEIPSMKFHQLDHKTSSVTHCWPHSDTLHSLCGEYIGVWSAVGNSDDVHNVFLL